MLRLLSIALALWSFSLPACQRKSEPAGSGPSASANASAPGPQASAQGSSTSAATKPANAPASARATIGGKPISEVVEDDLRAAFEKLGYTYVAGRKVAFGANETVVVKATLGDKAAAITVVRPTGMPDEGRMKIPSAAQQKLTFEKKGAAYLEGDVLVGAEVSGDPDAAKALLSAVLATND